MKYYYVEYWDPYIEGGCEMLDVWNEYTLRLEIERGEVIIYSCIEKTEERGT